MKRLNFCFQSGFVIDIMACLPYDLLHNFIGTSYTDIFSILKVTKSAGGVDTMIFRHKVMRLFRLGRVARALHRYFPTTTKKFMSPKQNAFASCAFFYIVPIKAEKNKRITWSEKNDI